MKRLVLGSLLIFASFGFAYARSALFEIVGTRVASVETGVQATYVITLNRALLVPGKPADVLLAIPDDPISVVLQPIDSKAINLPADQAAWRGIIDGKSGGAVLLVTGRGWVRAQIDGRRSLYVIKPAADGRMVLQVISPETAFPADEPPGAMESLRRLQKPSATGPLADCSDDPNVVDVAVPYTEAARVAAGGTVQIESEVAFAVAQTNLAYANSAVNHRLNLVFTGEVAYSGDNSSVDYVTLLSSLQNTTDGVLDGLATIRDTHRADLVALVVESGGACGIGYYVEPANVGAAPYGYSVVKRSCAGGNFTLAHEIGHNMGADHDRPNAGPHNSYNFAYGHIQPTPTGATPPWRTVMSYFYPCAYSSTNGSCARIAYFSNPAILVGGDASGDGGLSSPENNVAALNNTSPAVSQYRCSSSGSTSPNIWMKDRWEDTGLEPDPATAGQPMWESPHIWIRNSQDATLSHQHEHQNPTFTSSTNYAYVKIQNDGLATAGGELQLYWANASTDLNDPASWNLISAQPNATFGPGVQIVEFPWPTLPGVGHFCLMARWTTSTGTGPSFTSIDSYVRSGKAIVWRNVNITGGDEPMARTMDVNFGGPFGGVESYLVFTGRQVHGIGVPWRRVARVVIALDPRMTDRARTFGTGLKSLGEGRFALALGSGPVAIGPILAPQRSKLTLRVDLDSALAKKIAARQEHNAVFELRLIEATHEGIGAVLRNQESAFARPGLVAGGVTYNVTIRSPSGRDPTALPPKRQR